MKTFQKRLLRLVKESGITQREIATKAGVHASNLNRYLRQGVKPEGENLIALAQFFKVSTTWLLTGHSPASELQQSDEPKITTSLEGALTEREVKLIQWVKLEDGPDDLAGKYYKFLANAEKMYNQLEEKRKSKPAG